MEARKKAQPLFEEAHREGDDHGKVFISWVFPEYPRYHRGFVWYLVSVIIGAGLLISALVSGNFLFALIILMFALVIYMATAAEPADIEIAITEDGIALGTAFYPHRAVKSFWFVYEPPHVRNLYIDFKSAVRPRLTVDLMDENPNEVRKALSRHVPEDLTEEDEPLSEILGRVFKI